MVLHQAAGRMQKVFFAVLKSTVRLLAPKRAILWIWSKPFQSDGEAQQMSDKDYGYFWKGSTGYAQYKTSFDRNFGGPDKAGPAAALDVVLGQSGVCSCGGALDLGSCSERSNNSDHEHIQYVLVITERQSVPQKPQNGTPGKEKGTALCSSAESGILRRRRFSGDAF